MDEKKPAPYVVRGFPSILRPFKDNYDKNQHIGCIAGEKQELFV